ncbi:hypothetical protein [Paenibacillus silviterrae]|nr:hypothetical protein [Paenibacillus chinjuensis]
MPNREENASDEPRNDIMALVEWINSQGDTGEVNEIIERTNENAESER